MKSKEYTKETENFIIKLEDLKDSLIVYCISKNTKKLVKKECISII